MTTEEDKVLYETALRAAVRAQTREEQALRSMMLDGGLPTASQVSTDPVLRDIRKNLNSAEEATSQAYANFMAFAKRSRFNLSDPSDLALRIMADARENALNAIQTGQEPLDPPPRFVSPSAPNPPLPETQPYVVPLPLTAADQPIDPTSLQGVLEEEKKLRRLVANRNPYDPMAAAMGVNAAAQGRNRHGLGQAIEQMIQAGRDQDAQEQREEAEAKGLRAAFAWAGVTDTTHIDEYVDAVRAGNPTEGSKKSKISGTPDPAAPQASAPSENPYDRIAANLRVAEASQAQAQNVRTDKDATTLNEKTRAAVIGATEAYQNAYIAAMKQFAGAREAGETYAGGAFSSMPKGVVRGVVSSQDKYHEAKKHLEKVWEDTACLGDFQSYLEAVDATLVKQLGSEGHKLTSAPPISKKPSNVALEAIKKIGYHYDPKHVPVCAPVLSVGEETTRLDRAHEARTHEQTKGALEGLDAENRYAMDALAERLGLPVPPLTGVRGGKDVSSGGAVSSGSACTPKGSTACAR